MSPIEWDVSFAEVDPGTVTERLAAKVEGEGMVVVEASDELPVVRLSAVVRTARVPLLVLSQVAAFSASEGIRKDTGIITWVRWPDGIFIGEARVGSAAASLLPGKGKRAILRISVNRLHVSGPSSTSIEDELGVGVDSKILVDKILESLSWMHFGWTKGMEEHVMKRVVSMTETIGREVSFRLKGARERGRAVGIDSSGRLLVERDGGRLVKLTGASELLP